MKVLDKRLRDCTKISEAQFGFITYAIFTLRQLMEKYREKHRDKEEEDKENPKKLLILFIFLTLKKS